MAISHVRRNFRRFLYALLTFSFLFAGTATYFYITVKQDRSRLREITPALFEIDVLHHQAQARFKDREGKFQVARSLYQKGIFSKIYRDAGTQMMEELAYEGHPGAQTIYAGIILSKKPTQLETDQAIGLYKQAAAQNYGPAREQLTLFGEEKLAKAQTSP